MKMERRTSICPRARDVTQTRREYESEEGKRSVTQIGKCEQHKYGKEEDAGQCLSLGSYQQRRDGKGTDEKYELKQLMPQQRGGFRSVSVGM